MKNIMKRKYTSVKLMSVLFILLAVIFQMICGKENGVSVFGYITGAFLLLCPAKGFEFFGLR